METSNAEAIAARKIPGDVHRPASALPESLQCRPHAGQTLKFAAGGDDVLDRHRRQHGRSEAAELGLDPLGQQAHLLDPLVAGDRAHLRLETSPARHQANGGQAELEAGAPGLGKLFGDEARGPRFLDERTCAR